MSLHADPHGSAVPAAKAHMRMGGHRRPLPVDGPCLGLVPPASSYSVLRACCAWRELFSLSIGNYWQQVATHAA